MVHAFKRQEGLWVWVQPGLQSKLQVSQACVDNSSQNRTTESKMLVLQSSCDPTGAVGFTKPAARFSTLYSSQLS